MLKFTKKADADYTAALVYLRESAGPAAALAFAEMFEESCARLVAFPKSGSAVTDVDVRGLRRFPVEGYMLFYRPRAFGIHVSRVLHQSRDHRQEFRKRKKSA